MAISARQPGTHDQSCRLLAHRRTAPPNFRNKHLAARDGRAGAFELPEGTVYPALHRLEEAGLLASTWDVVSGRRRRIYQLTTAGEAALAAEAKQWREFSGSMTRVLGASVLPILNRAVAAGGMA